MRTDFGGFLEIFRPNLMAESVTSVDTADLWGLGIRALLLDLDNTLVPWHRYDVPESVLAWLREAESQGMRLCIVSNTRYPGRLKRLAEQLQLPFVKGWLKPRRSAFRPALELLGAAPDQAAVIGDQLLTDILGGNRLGLYTILVKPLGRREFFGTKISRIFERAILRALASSPQPSAIPSRCAREQSPDACSQTEAEQ